MGDWLAVAPRQFRLRRASSQPMEHPLAFVRKRKGVFMLWAAPERGGPKHEKKR